MCLITMLKKKIVTELAYKGGLTCIGTAIMTVFTEHAWIKGNK